LILDKQPTPDTKQTLYLNTGTWARLMHLTPEVLENEMLFAQVWNALPAGSKSTMPADVLVDQPTVAVIRQREKGGPVQAALCEFNDNAEGGFQLAKGVTKKPEDGTLVDEEASWENLGRQS